MLSGVYAKSFILANGTARAVMRVMLFDRLLPLVAAAAAAADEPLEVLALLSSYSLDVFTGYQFGLAGGTNLLQRRRRAALLSGRLFRAPALDVLDRRAAAADGVGTPSGQASAWCRAGPIRSRSTSRDVADGPLRPGRGADGQQQQQQR